MARRASCDPSTAPALSLGAHLSRPAQRLLADPSNEFFGTVDTLYYDNGRGLMALLKNVIPLINRRKLGLPSGMLEGGRIYSDTELFVTDMAGKTLERARRSVRTGLHQPPSLTCGLVAPTAAALVRPADHAGGLQSAGPGAGGPLPDVR